MRSMDSRRGLALILAALLLMAGCGGGGDSGSSYSLSPTALAAKCQSLGGQAFAGVTVTDASYMDAIPGVSTSPLCKVSGTRAPYLDIEVDLPADWSGRYWQNGGGGFNGTIPTAFSRNEEGAVTSIHPMIVSKQAVYAASNGGNRRSVADQQAPEVWASGTAQGADSARDYSYRSLETTLAFAKALMQQVYEQAPRYRYFNGCSNGGREAYIVVERWPNEFDGVVSGCETGDMASQTAAWLSLAKVSGTAAELTPAQYRAAYQRAVTACDGDDGATDGYLSNSANCRYEPARLQCGAPTASTDASECLNAAQVGTLQSLLSELRLQDGTLIYAGFDWADFSDFAPSFGYLGGGFALLGTGDPAWLTAARQRNFNLEADYPLIKTGLMQSGADHDLTAIATYVASGRKLLSWHDTGDNLLSGREHARRQAMLQSMVKGMGVPDPEVNSRFMLVPGSFHGAGASLEGVRWDTAIVDWVEQGLAPTQLTYTLAEEARQPSRSLPVCLAPKTAFYSGVGDQNAVSSYVCR